MLRRTQVDHAWKAAYEFQRVRHTLQGRAKHDFSLGWRHIHRQLTVNTAYRVEGSKQRYEGSIIQNRLNSAATEHGTSNNNLILDQARQRMYHSSAMMVRLGQYEPLAFRSFVELCGSKIPPPQPLPQKLPIQVNDLEDGGAKDGISLELQEDVKRLLRQGSKMKGSPINELHQSEAEEVVLDKWMNAWQEFKA